MQKTEEWNDWKWQMRNMLRTAEHFQNAFRIENLPPSEELESLASNFPIGITPYYASLMKEFTPNDPIFRMQSPHGDELMEYPHLSDDPFDEIDYSPLPGLVRRYKDRALIVTTGICACYCRYCTRKRVAGKDGMIKDEALGKIVVYLRSKPEIREVLLSGGDPLTLETSQLEKIILAVKKAENIEIIRIGTKVPVSLPMRVDDELVAMLKKHRPVWISTHFNHPNEVTDESRNACDKLVSSGIPLNNQAVLLKGVNDAPEIIERLFRQLIQMSVRPYYLFQSDLIRGAEHFRTPLQTGLDIMEYLRANLTGIAVPQFVIDTPKGKGKVPVLPEYIVKRSSHETLLRNSNGEIISYPEPLGVLAY